MANMKDLANLIGVELGEEFMTTSGKPLPKCEVKTVENA